MLEDSNRSNDWWDIVFKLGGAVGAVLGSIGILINRIRRWRNPPHPVENGNGNGNGKILNERVDQAYEHMGESYESMQAQLQHVQARHEELFEKYRQTLEELSAAKSECASWRFRYEFAKPLGCDRNACDDRHPPPSGD